VLFNSKSFTTQYVISVCIHVTTSRSQINRNPTISRFGFVSKTPTEEFHKLGQIQGKQK